MKSSIPQRRNIDSDDLRQFTDGAGKGLAGGPCAQSRLQVSAGCWLLASGWWLVVVGCWPQAASVLVTPGHDITAPRWQLLRLSIPSVEGIDVLLDLGR